MRKILITTIINFCSNDLRFLEKCILEAKCFSDEVIVVSSDHFFDGTVENREKLEQAYSLNAKFIEYKFSKDRLYSQFIDSDPSDLNWQMYWYGTSRFVGFFYAKHEYLLFLDADEIVEGKTFSHWLKKGLTKDAYRFRSYFYFQSANKRALTYPTNALLVRKKALNPHTLINDWDRKGVYSRINGTKEIIDTPIIHHYSWVKTKEECHKKAKTSGHWWEKDWKTLIDAQFDQGSDFAFSYDYETVKPYFDPLSYSLPKGTPKDPLYVSREVISKKELEYTFNLSSEC